MIAKADKAQENKSQPVANCISQKQCGGESTVQLLDTHPKSIAQRRLQGIANDSRQIKQLKTFQDVANNSLLAKQTAQLQAMANENIGQQQLPIQKKENNTGLPDHLKSGIENLSGQSMDDVKVHYNSDKPAQLNAHAYAQGTDIHIASGQERHLPHEAWHVVQQKQGRVKPTIQMLERGGNPALAGKGKVNINDDAGLEKEADVMGAKALQMKSNQIGKTSMSKVATSIPVQRVAQLVKLVRDKLNVAGETHPESNSRRPLEKQVSQNKTGSDNYWTEGEFKMLNSNNPADPYQLRYCDILKSGLSLQIGTFAGFTKEDYLKDMDYGDLGAIKVIEIAMDQLYADDLEYYGEKIHGQLQEQDVWIAGLRRVIRHQCSVAKEIVKGLENGNTTDTGTDISNLTQQVRKSKPLDKAIDEVMKGLDELNKALAKANIDFNLSNRDISTERSGAMHATAQARAGVKGVWKVGDKHVIDMQKEDGRQYNLLSKKDFDDEIESNDSSCIIC